MKNKKIINLKLVKQQQFSKYSSYDIPIDILEEAFNKVKDIPDEMELILAFQKLVNEYIINEIKNDNINLQIIIIEKNQYIKKLIVKNPKYNLPSQDIESIYDQAIELLKNRYNKNELISNNILNNMKYIILKNNKQIEHNEKKYDISFFKKYINLYEIDINEYLPIFGYTYDVFMQMLDGEVKIDKNDMLLLCSLFGVDEYDKLKNLIEDKIEFFIEKEKRLNQKKKKKHIVKATNKDIKYDMSFMKEYVQLNNVSKSILASLWHCGIQIVDKILNGQTKLPDNLLFETLEHFNVNSYEELKYKVLLNINNIKENKKRLTNKTKQKTNEPLIENKILSIESIDENRIMEILNVKNMNYRDILITLMLFNKNIDKSIDDIAEFLSINKSYVLKIYINDLDLIKENLLKENKNLILTHKNEEID